MEGQLFIRVENPSLVLGQICQLVEQALWPKKQPGVHPSAVIAEGVNIPESVYIGPFCNIESGVQIGEGCIIEAYSHIGANAKIGDGTWLMPRATIYNYCVLGKKCCINSGAVIGSPGFGFELGSQSHMKIPQIGHVELGDGVDVGANTTIDRARFSKTIVGAGTKIDNLVQVAHNVKIGSHCIIVSQVGISGSTTLGNQVIVGGQTGFTGHITIGDKCMIGAQSGINHDIKAGSYVRGAPAFPYMQAHRLEILKKRLPEFFTRLKKVEALVESLTSPTEA